MIRNGAQFDPAFAYVLRHGSWTAPPFPSGRSVPKVVSAYIQRVWNADVDKYIALGLDGRSREVIERATKIGPTCGALFRVCEGVDCNKMEGVEVEKLHMCARCKLVSPH
ncbi:hypothetical protein BV22DRAFT_941909 [Leucogyrophana mollusca]|uniref:Uncharacterized protein n=1 Tax=Leucogyrophana mollusca TaxID=85980 RepID=A0ACB8AVA8_9AGAM|nr:hypothetical protein BV22DRAFT_941909 [Leucogyrophana mollusca]